MWMGIKADWGLDAQDGDWKCEIVRLMDNEGRNTISKGLYGT